MNSPIYFMEMIKKEFYNVNYKNNIYTLEYIYYYDCKETEFKVKDYYDNDITDMGTGQEIIKEWEKEYRTYKD